MIGPTDPVHRFPAPHFTTLQIFPIYSLKFLKFQHHTKLCSKCSTLLVSALKVQFAVKRVFFLLKAAFYLGSLASFDIMLPTYFKYSTFSICRNLN